MSRLHLVSRPVVKIMAGNASFCGRTTSACAPRNLINWCGERDALGAFRRGWAFIRTPIVYSYRHEQPAPGKYKLQ